MPRVLRTSTGKESGVKEKEWKILKFNKSGITRTTGGISTVRTTGRRAATKQHNPPTSLFQYTLFISLFNSLFLLPLVIHILFGHQRVSLLLFFVVNKSSKAIVTAGHLRYIYSLFQKAQPKQKQKHEIYYITRGSIHNGSGGGCLNDDGVHSIVETNNRIYDNTALRGYQSNHTRWTTLLRSIVKANTRFRPIPP